jgi:di/tricarboxylate transporter
MDYGVVSTVTILLAAVALLALNRIRPDVVAILVLVALVVFGQVDTQEALAGFSSPAVLSIAALLVLSGGLVRSGAVRWLAVQLQRAAGSSRRRLLVVSVLPPAILSGVVNIVAAVSILIPAILHLARENRVSPRQLLLPMALTSLAGANLTLIGAGHNLVVDSLLRESGEAGLGFFEISPLGLILVAAFLAYNLLFAHRLLSGNEASEQPEQTEQEDLVATYHLQERLWEVWVREDAPVAGTPLAQIAIGQRYGLSVISLLRNGRQQPVDDVSIGLQGKDVLLVGGRREKVEQLCAENEGLVLAGPPEPQTAFPSSEAELVEVIVPPRSDAIGKTLRELRLRAQMGLIGLAVWRQGQPRRTDARDIPLQAGDGVLLFGARMQTRHFEPRPDFLWLQSPHSEASPPELGVRAILATAILLAVVVLGATGWLSIAIAALAGAAAMILLGILTTGQAYEAVDWRTIALIGGMYPLGTALQNSGTVDLVSRLLSENIGAAGPHGMLWAIGLLAILLTQPMHSAVVAVILTPVAISVAQSLGVDATPFALAVIVGASASFLLPAGHPATLLVQSPGRYGTADYVRFGIAPVLIVWAVIGLVIPWIWPLSQAS